jgi:hypothetical protein
MSSETRRQRLMGMLSTGEDVAHSLSLEVLRTRAERLDKILNFRMLPQLGIHAALIGACVLVGTDTVSVPPLLFALLAAAFAAGFVATHARGWRGSGLLGAAVTFATAGVLVSGMGPVPAILMLALIFGALAFVLLRWDVSRREIVFAPIYAAILILQTTEGARAFVIYAPIFLIGMIAVAIGKHITWSFGLFIGLLILISNRLEDDTTIAVVGFLAFVGLFLLLLYVARSVSARDSNMRNFIIQGVGSWMFIGLITVFKQDLPAWTIPVLMGFFFAFVSLFRRNTTGAPTAIAWLYIASLLAYWSYADAEDPSYTDVFVRLLVTITSAKLLELAARGFRAPLVGNVALLTLLIAAGGATFMAWGLGDEGLPGSVPQLIQWSGYAIPKVLILALLPIIAVTSCYAPIVPAQPVPWWRGLARPRHILFVRTCYRVSQSWLSAIPLIGAPLRGIGSAFRALRYMKTGGERLRLADVVLIATVALFYVSFMKIAYPFLQMIPMAEIDGSPRNLGWAADAISAAICGLMLYGIGLQLRQSLFFFAGAIMVLGQFGVYAVRHWDLLEKDQLGLLTMLLGLVLVVCAGIRALYVKARDLRAATVVVVAAPARVPEPVIPVPPPASGEATVSLTAADLGLVPKRRKPKAADKAGSEE